MPERRGAIRTSDSDLVMLTWDEDSVPLKQLGNIEDVSKTGLGVIVEQALPVSTKVHISYRDNKLTGTVRHYFAREYGFFMGIELEPGSSNPILPLQLELLYQERAI